MESDNGNFVLLAPRDLRAQLDRIEMSADAKAVLGRLIQTTVAVGQKVFEVGRKVVSFALDLMNRFRGITFGIGIALTVSVLVASVPLVGATLASFLTPLLLAFGLTRGALEDVSNGALRDRVSGFAADMGREAHA